ncbi:glycine-rich RNA-binding protein 3 [Forsythia ovata]|uniref:Glycine-rich RNA-binding protein 3 n=1 Tax=Forsythia ovata TaxID=205694 RepID=A0ABD1QTY9_9LAMI
MAFFRKAGNILRQTMSNHISQEISTSKPSIFQAIRCMSTSKLFVGGLSYSTDDSGLREAFSKYGEVAEDRDTGRSRGFGFVTFSTVEDASAAIQALDQQNFGVAGGGGGSDNNNVGAGNSSSSSGFDLGQFKFDAPEESKSMEGAGEGPGQDKPAEGNYRDDDDAPGNYADRRG